MESRETAFSGEIEAQKKNEIRVRNEAEKDKELVTLIANILVIKTLKNAAEKGYPVPPL
jgi:hypothetical protein